LEMNSSLEGSRSSHTNSIHNLETTSSKFLTPEDMRGSQQSE
jgi:hypothetical protein